LTDTVVVELRREISAVDRELLGAVNRRIEIVQRLHGHKQQAGMPLRDPEREVELVRELQDENPGPLSDEGVASLFHFVLGLTRNELYDE
jgi:chorismate mutase / prephenate dehydratase